MTEKLKTRSEVLAELETAKRIIKKQMNTDVLIIDGPYDCLFLEVKDPDAEFGHKNGILNPFTPDPDTKIHALEKAHKLHLELTAADTVKDCSLTNGMKYYVVDWVTKIDNWNHSEQFPFADPAPESEFITDEPPPVEVAVESLSGAHYLSTGQFKDGKLEVISAQNRTINLSNYKSITTLHRSRDWVD